ncbi:ribosomal large subunit (23S rRNA) pseudouridine synthase C [Legionella birminghamensis]|uniref:Pseudouridine synthase n=1 Tax=Legionella birminghamensis TaxID=28083 RepID=A0A378ICB9_9GAMM|nr:RluA family pseudouridine synthase [Legionella birminghamensis]KTC74316.1 ribosomal large subunit (23S rRNA) pseudouridine synthase C [Legionella birminghamensis]STX32566.1 ribosomal large subunit (23S rRNA) pseudouridine synthase C [Legionella birminghamensis]
MNDVRYLEVTANEEGQRLDNYLMRVLKGVPKSHIYRIIRSGEVRINKKRAQAASRLMEGDILRIPPVRTSQEKEHFVGDRLEQLLKKSIIYEDNELLVINKPAGIAVHGGSGLSLGVIEALRKIRTDLHYLELVHRLDRDTSGCLLLAKKRSALRLIQAQLESREVKKIYWALLHNTWTDNRKILVDQPLKKNILHSGERVVIVHPEGKPSQTEFRLLENYADACWVEASPRTGRTHQIRVHSAYLKHPIAGDEKYGGARLSYDFIRDRSRLYLHARSIQFNLKDKKLCFEAELDEQFSQTLKFLRTRECGSHE